MPRCYPISLNIENRLCLVVGGGKVAGRKVMSLLDCGARVRLVSPELCEELQNVVQSGRVRYIRDCYRKEHLEGAFLVIGATDSDEINHRVSQDCMQSGLLINVVDDPPRGNFYVPAVLRRGHLQIAVSTDGKSPLLARKVKEQLGEVFPGEYGEIVNLIGELREKIIKNTADAGEKETILASMLDEDTMEMLREKKFDLAKERILNAFLGSGCQPQDSSR